MLIIMNVVYIDSMLVTTNIGRADTSLYYVKI
jgi:hypothetical protein